MIEQDIDNLCMLLEKLAFRANEAADALERIKDMSGKDIADIKTWDDFFNDTHYTDDTVLIPRIQEPQIYNADITAVMPKI